MGKTSKYFWILFWLFVPYILAGVLSDEYWKAYVPFLKYIGETLSIICGLAVAYCCFKLSEQCNKYIYAAYLGIITTVTAIIRLIVPSFTKISMVMIPIVIIYMIIKLLTEYFEYKGHQLITAEVDEKLTKRWHKLLIWNMIFSCMYIIGAILVLFEATITIGSMLSMFSPLVLGLLQLLRIWYLYNTAQLFSLIDRRRNN